MGERESQRARRDAADICARLQDAGHTAYFAGGCVRDELLGRSPDDYDVATDATPERVKQLFKRVNLVGAAFGVCLVTSGKGDAKTVTEVATFRSDGPYTDKRRPDHVTFSDPEEDAARRDFTINALFLDPLAPDEGAIHGHVVDFVDGKDDLRDGVIRAVGDADARLAEDNLRALRAARFAARLGFEIEPATAQAIRRHAAELAGVSRERIGGEMRRMLGAPSRGGAIALLDALDLLGPTLNAGETVHLVQGAAARLARLPDEIGFSAALAALMLEIEAPRLEAGDIRSALMLSNDEEAGARAVLERFESITRDWAGLGVASKKRLIASVGFDEALALVRAGITRISDGTAEDVGREWDRLAGTPSGIAPPPLISGDDLVALKLRPGPHFKRILDLVYDQQLEDRLPDRGRALEAARELARSLGVETSG